MSHLSRRSLAKLAERSILRIDPRRTIAVKRNVHELVIDAPADRFARAFHAVLTEPDARFGRIEVRRDPSRDGKPFEVGERFHGCFSIAASYPRTASFFERAGLAALVTRFEDAFLSDYSMITSLVEERDAFRAAYTYLEGSPIAGESRFEVTSRGGRCRLEVVFLYQEIGALAVLVLHLLGARLHDEVVLEQVERAAARAGGTIVSSTMGVPATPRVRASREHAHAVPS